MFSAVSKELYALDADMVAEEYLDKLQLEESSIVMESSRKHSIESATSHGTDSGHATLVVDWDAGKGTEPSNGGAVKSQNPPLQ